MYRNFSFDERFIIKLHSKSFMSNFWSAVQILIQPLFAIYTICSKVKKTVASANVGDSSHGQWLMIAMPDNSRYCRDWL